MAEPKKKKKNQNSCSESIEIYWNLFLTKI